MADAAGPSVTVLYLHKGKQSAGVSRMFLAPSMIAVMQTGLLIAVGMQAMMLPPIITTPGRTVFRVERERDGRGIPDQSGTPNKSSTVGSRPTASLRMADPFGLSEAQDGQGDTRYAA
jgi:hypothetical protein